MAKQDLIAALRNALERNESLQQAKLSLISAGYSQNDVEDAARTLQFPQVSAMPKLNEIKELKTPEAKEKIEAKKLEVRAKKPLPLWFIVLLILFLGLVGYIIFILMRR